MYVCVYKFTYTEVSSMCVCLYVCVCVCVFIYVYIYIYIYIVRVWVSVCVSVCARVGVFVYSICALFLLPCITDSFACVVVLHTLCPSSIDNYSNIYSYDLFLTSFLDLIGVCFQVPVNCSASHSDFCHRC